MYKGKFKKMSLDDFNKNRSSVSQTDSKAVFTPIRIGNAQSALPSHKVDVLNEIRCNNPVQPTSVLPHTLTKKQKKALYEKSALERIEHEKIDAENLRLKNDKQREENERKILASQKKIISKECINVQKRCDDEKKQNLRKRQTKEANDLKQSLLSEAHERQMQLKRQLLQEEAEQRKRAEEEKERLLQINEGKKRFYEIQKQNKQDCLNSSEQSEKDETGCMVCFETPDICIVKDCKCSAILCSVCFINICHSTKPPLYPCCRRPFSAIIIDIHTK